MDRTICHHLSGRLKLSAFKQIGMYDFELLLYWLSVGLLRLLCDRDQDTKNART